MTIGHRKTGYRGTCDAIKGEVPAGRLEVITTRKYFVQGR